MNACRYSENLVAFLDEELSEQERADFESHLSNCQSCGETIDQQRSLGSALASLPTVDPSPGFETRFWARIAREDQAAEQRREQGFWARAGWRGWLVGLTTAAVAAGAVMLALRPPGPELDPDFALVADAEQFELLADADIELLEVMEILEAWDGQEI